jgi:hypothetical protein
MKNLLPLYFTKKAILQIKPQIPETAFQRMPVAFQVVDGVLSKADIPNSVRAQTNQNRVPPPGPSNSNSPYHRNVGNHEFPLEPNQLKILLDLFNKQIRQPSKSRKMVGLFFIGDTPTSAAAKEMQSYMNTAQSEYKAAGYELMIREINREDLTPEENNVLDPSFRVAAGKPMLILLALAKTNKANKYPSAVRAFRYFSRAALISRKLHLRTSKFQHF